MKCSGVKGRVYNGTEHFCCINPAVHLFWINLVVSLKIEYNTYRPTPILTDPSNSGISGGEVSCIKK